MIKRKVSRSQAETIKTGKEYASLLKPGDILGLDGELGSGKTQFVKGIAQYFGVREIVNSPTFIIVNEYKGRLPADGKTFNIYHFDLYRIVNSVELETIGFDDYLNKDSICVIEWSLKAEEYLNTSLVKVCFEHGTKNNERIISYEC